MKLVKYLFLIVTLCGCSSLAAQQSDFSVQFNGPSKSIPPGLVYGLNDLQNASQGVWQTWAQAVKPTDGVVRIWVKRYLGKLDNSHIKAAKTAQRAGLAVMLTVVGDAGDKRNKDSNEGDHVLRKPSDPRQWALDFAKDVREMKKSGIDVRYVEIWNEPDMPGQWNGSRQEFANFFAKAGKVLRENLDSSVKVGGPGMASGWGLSMQYFELIFDACKRQSFEPDFMSWHHYGSYASDNEFLKTATLIEKMATTRGLKKPETILSEWNISLPHPIANGMDSNIGAAFWSAMVSSLIQTPTSHALFFFLQDGSWETTEDFAQKSVGAFTLRGAPKSIFAAMRLMAEVAKAPAVPMKRLAAFNNLTCVATRSQQSGQLLITNAPGDIYRAARKFLASSGFDMGDLKDKDSNIKSFFSGKTTFDKLALNEKWRPYFSQVKVAVGRMNEEKKKSERWVSIALDLTPKEIARVRLIDEDNGNPIASSAFREAFAPYEGGYGPEAIRNTIDELKKQAIPESECVALERAFMAGERNINIAGVSSANSVLARAVMDRQIAKLRDDVPKLLAEHPASSASVVDGGEWVRIDGQVLMVKVPPHSIVVVDLVL
ncbi:MAG: glycosyl hydrolase [Planctomycetota bacterium]|nr:glycosyl hydrolase [Planctomycetota bacterium]